jgi:hypothetical protein
MERAHALEIPQLLELCMEFLCYMAPEFGKTCAMVSRSWASAVQVQLFRELSLKHSDPMHRVRSKLRTLHTSPHLIRHIRFLTIDAAPESLTILAEVGNLPFTRLVHVSISQSSDLDLPIAMAIQRLFNIPTLRRVKLACDFTRPAVFRGIWDRCSPSIRHLDISYSRRAVQSMQWHSDVPVVPDIRLESLRLAAFKDDLPPGVYPFDLSGLKVLSIGAYTKWNAILPAVQDVLALGCYMVRILLYQGILVTDLIHRA